MKKFLSFCILLVSLAGNAQNFNIAPIIRDSISSDSYLYHVNGAGEFSDSMIVHVELITEGDNSTIEFSGMYDFKNLASSTLTNFNYNPESLDFSFSIGNFTVPDLFLHMWLTTIGSEEKSNEIYYKQ